MPTVVLPRLLDPATGGRRSIEVRGDTIEAALDSLLAEMPAVEVHLFDHTGALRPHVLCFVDSESNRLEDRQARIGPGSRIRFLQAVSGG